MFCLSCRALGISVEDEMLNFALGKHKINDFVFKSTTKNSDIKNYLEKKIGTRVKRF